MPIATGFVPPPYPFDRLGPIAEIAKAHVGGMVDLSIGTPCDPAPASVVEALSHKETINGYPNSVGSPAFRSAAATWMARKYDITIDPEVIGACIGTKEFVATTPHYLHLRYPERDTVLYPEISYPTYEMGAQLAGLRAVTVPLASDGSLAVESISKDDAARALCIWSNSPSNPTGHLDDLRAVALWARAHDTIALSDECYAEFVWDDQDARHLATPTMISAGVDNVVVVHSLSKRSNAAGIRAGFFAGDPEIVGYLREVRKHAGLMVPGPVQEAAIAAWSDQQHVDVQREIYAARLARLSQLIQDTYDVPVTRPQGGFYLWLRGPDNVDGWEFARRLATDLGVLCSPGDFYGAASADWVRLAVVQPDAAFDLIKSRAETLVGAR